MGSLLMDLLIARKLIVGFTAFLVSLTALPAAEAKQTNDYAAVDALFTQHCLDCHATQVHTWR